MPDNWTLISLLLGALIAALLLAIGHWFPWIQRLRRLHAYTYGTAALWAGFTLWRLLNRDWLTPAGYLLIVAAGGATVHLAYKLDAWILAIRQARKAEDTHDRL